MGPPPTERSHLIIRAELQEVYKVVMMCVLFYCIVTAVSERLQDMLGFSLAFLLVHMWKKHQVRMGCVQSPANTTGTWLTRKSVCDHNEIFIHRRQTKTQYFTPQAICVGSQNHLSWRAPKRPCGPTPAVHGGIHSSISAPALQPDLGCAQGWGTTTPLGTLCRCPSTSL